MCTLFAGLSAARAELPKVDLHIIDMPLAQVFDVLSDEFDIQFVGDQGSRLRVSNLRLQGSSENIIEQLKTHLRIDVFTFNGNYYYAPIDERAVRLVPLADDISAEEARAALENAQLIQPGFQVSDVANGGALVLSGPVQYLALSESVLNALTVTPDEAASTPRVRRGGILESAASANGAELSSTN